MNSWRGPLVRPQVIIGVAVVLVGVVFLLDNLGRADAGQWLRYWPTVLIAIGLSRLGGRSAGERVFAAGWIVAGTWFLLDELDLIDFSPWEYFWPLALIVAGAALAFGALRRQSTATDPFSPNAFAFLSGLNRRSTSNDFQGADLTAFCGGAELDLRDAGISSGEAQVNVFAMWGGVEIKVPTGWIVESRVLPIMGAFEDSTRQEPADNAPRLVIKGTVFMGGGEVKN